MGTFTPNFGFSLPTIAGDVNIWGELLNEMTILPIDSLFRRSINTFIDPTPPAEAQGGTFWMDNTTDPWIWSMFDGTDWIPVGTFDITNNTFTVSNGGGGSAFFTGDLKQSGQPADHGNWLLCDGRAVSRTTYSVLFDLYNAYTNPLPFGNGDGSTTFNIPDGRGKVVGGVGTGTYTGATTRSYGEFVGLEATMLASTAIPAGAPVATTGSNPQGFDILVSTKPNPLYPSVQAPGNNTHGLHNNTLYSTVGAVNNTPFGSWTTTGGDNFAANFVSLGLGNGNTPSTSTNIKAFIDTPYITPPNIPRAYFGFASIVGAIAANQVTFGTIAPSGGQTGTPVMQPTLFAGNWFVYAT